MNGTNGGDKRDRVVFRAGSTEFYETLWDATTGTTYGYVQAADGSRVRGWVEASEHDGVIGVFRPGVRGRVQ